jgi:uncharacterized membrane protein YgcG
MDFLSNPAFLALTALALVLIVYGLVILWKLHRYNPPSIVRRPRNLNPALEQIRVRQLDALQRAIERSRQPAPVIPPGWQFRPTPPPPKRPVAAKKKAIVEESRREPDSSLYDVLNSRNPFYPPESSNDSGYQPSPAPSFSNVSSGFSGGGGGSSWDSGSSSDSSSSDSGSSDSGSSGGGTD